MAHIQNLTNIFLYSAFSFFIFLFFTPIFYKTALKYSIRKKLREKTSDGKKAKIFMRLHKKKNLTPTMGGLLIWGTTAFTVFFSRFLSLIGIIPSSLLQRGQVYLPLFTLITMGIFGAIDDIFNIKEVGRKKGIDVKPKFFLLTFFAAIGALWFYYKLGYNSIHIPRIGDFYIDFWYIPIFIFIIVATANAVNITDGLDGLAGGLLIIAFGAFAGIAYSKGLIILAIFCCIIISALLGFLWFNIPPAKFYMGDTGSLSLGATLGVIAMMTDSIIVLPLIGFIFVIETFSVIIQLTSKKIFKKKVFNIAPLHHHLETLKWGEAKITMRLWTIGAFAAAIGLIIGLLGS